MSGIIFFGILAVWFFVAIKLTNLFTSGIRTQSKRNWLYPLILVLISFGPVLDEIIGGFQFRALCTPENMLIYDAEKVKGKTVQYKSMPSYSITGKMLPIRVTHTQFVDPKTNAVLIEYRIFRARRGWLVKSIGWPHSLNRRCSSKEYYQLFEKLDITKVEE